MFMDENIFKCFWEETYQELVTENKNKGDFVNETRFKGKKTKKKNEKEILHWQCTHIIVVVFVIIFLSIFN